MSSLALQLFVNLNKLIQLQPRAELGPHYAKQLVERVRAQYPALISCADPSNAHTAALSAFALGMGLRQMRQEGADKKVTEVLAGILNIALERADEGLEQLAPDELHLVLQAHEDYKTHLGVREEPDHARKHFGQTRGVADVVPLATTRTPQPVKTQPVHNAATIPSSNETQTTAKPQIPMRAEEPSTSAPIEIMHPSVDRIEEYGPEQPPTEQGREGLMQLKELRAGISQVSTPALPTLHPVRQDRNAEREFADNMDISPENIDTLLARRRQQDMGRQQAIPMHAAWEGVNQERVAQKPAMQNLPSEESQWSNRDSHTSTYLHSESAPDGSAVARRRKNATPSIIWAIPAFLILPPLGLFYSGVLWGRGAYRQSAFAMTLGVIGAGGLIAGWVFF